MSDFYPHLERRKQREQPRHRLLWVIVIVVPAVVLSLLGPPLGRLAHHIAADYELADAAAQAKTTRDGIAPKVGLDDPFSKRRALPQLRGLPPRKVAGPIWDDPNDKIDENAARVIDEPDIGFAFRIDTAWVCRVTVDGPTTAKCFSSSRQSTLRLRIVGCDDGCTAKVRRDLDAIATQGLTGDPVELTEELDDERTRFVESTIEGQYRLITTHVYNAGKTRKHLTLMSLGPADEKAHMQRAINDALTQAG